ncbi:MAG: glycosyltransferase family 2 protein [Ferruginibacter sp.]
MKVTGFSFIKNAEKYHYPIIEALRSILPLCDEIVVAVGNSEDNTRAIVEAVDPKIRVINTVWDDALKGGGKVLAAETDKALASIGSESDWCIYIQGDEVMHEAGHKAVMNAMLKWKDVEKVDGLLLKYIHFFGSYDHIANESGWYRNEIRVIKNNKSFYSYRDAQGFRKGNNEKLNVKPVDAWIHHYGWVHELKNICAKFIVKDKIYFGKEGDLDNITVPDNLIPYLVRSLKKFTGTHPKVMLETISKTNLNFEYDLSTNRLKWKDRFKNLVEKITGKRPFDYQNYKII